MSISEPYPEASIFIRNNDREEEARIARDIFFDVTVYFRKSDIRYSLHSRPGSIEIALKLFYDFFSHPAVAAVTAQAVGAVLRSVIERKDSARLIPKNRSWVVAEELKKFLDRNPGARFESFKQGPSELEVEYKDKSGKKETYRIKESVVVERVNSPVQYSQPAQPIQEMLDLTEQMSIEDLENRLNGVENQVENFAEDTHELEDRNPAEERKEYELLELERDILKRIMESKKRLEHRK